ncbi:MAG: DEAD/DEAH box helicase [Clostridiales bacterium]|nr:DEAD/DEAH box helicase [Clostridiales bacterium]
MTFEELGLNTNIISGLKKENIVKPTEIQNLCIKEALLNKDIIGESHTGSGKTLAFLCPLFQKINTEKKENQGLILAPTHELVMQIENEIKLLAKNSNMDITSMAVIGDVNIEKQIKKLKDIKPHIIVGSTGRVMDLIKKKKITPHTIKTIVIDEGDNLLLNTSSDMVKDIIKKAMKDTQLMVFSATMSKKALDTCKTFMKNPSIFKTKESIPLNPNIEHFYLKVEERDKFEVLRKLIAATNPTKTLVFINGNYQINKISDKLNYLGKNAFTLHKGISKEERQKALESFRNGKINILISSDISARGLDIKDITHIINLDFPLTSTEYLHRAGRTARGEEEKGYTISLVTNKDLSKIKTYEKEFKIRILEKKLSHGKLI